MDATIGIFITYMLHVLLQGSSLVLIPWKALGPKHMLRFIINIFVRIIIKHGMHIFLSKVETWVGYKYICMVSTVT